MSIALLIARLLIGLGMAAHGSQKLFGWFGGYGLSGTGGYFESLGFRPGVAFAFFGGLAELGAGLLIACGLGGALGPALLVMVMLVAIWTVHLPKGYWAAGGGYELNLTLIAAGLAFAFAGFGAYSLDHALGLSILTSSHSAWWAMLAALILSLLNLAARRPAPTSPPS